MKITVTKEKTMIDSFDSIGLNSNLIEGLKNQGINEPTPVQVNAIPKALENKDIIGESQTGSGKTLAYLLPIFQKIDPAKRENQALVLAPTHELVMQIDKQVKLLSENSGMQVTSATIIGDVNVERQIVKLREKPHIIIGSTGRVFELIKKKKISAHTVKTIVIDEGDRMLDQYNIGGVKDVIKTTMRDRQLMVFSATIDDKTLKAASELMKDPEVIRITETKTVNPNITHMYFEVEQRDKIEMLRKLVASIKPERAIVFINRSDEIEMTTMKLQYHNLKAFGIHGSATKEERKKAMEDFRKGSIQLLVASDIAARGLDIEGVTHIFNLDVPQDPRDYLHRAGRTGRVDNPGTAVSIVTQQELPLIKRYERDFNIHIEAKDIYMGNIIDMKEGKQSAIKDVRKTTNYRRK
jgi:superfamily II DNA/RNA helicase